MAIETEVLNEAGDAQIVLTDHEEALANRNQEICNSFGFEINITTLTAISKRVTEQKFFEIMPADYMAVRVGEGAWSSNIVTYRSFTTGGDFEQGNINTGSGNARLASSGTAVDSITVPVVNWAKQIDWTLFDIELAARSGNWDLITSLEVSRKQNWDLGIQKIAFLGSLSTPNVYGLLTQPNVNSNTSLIGSYLSTMDAATFTTFVAGVYGAYRTNCNFTAKPDKFIMPEIDFDGMAAPYSATYPNISKFDYLLKAFQLVTGNKNFQILPCAYADEVNNAGFIGKNRYTLTNGNPDSLRMDIPVNYTNTLQNTLNGFQYQNVGYGQYTGAKAYRELETLYFDFT